MLCAAPASACRQSLTADHDFFRAAELGVEEAEIEHGVMRDQRRVAEKFDQLVHLVGEQRLVLRKSMLNPCTLNAASGMSRSGLK